MDTLNEWVALLVLVADIGAIIHVWFNRIEVGRKVVWSLVILLLPVVGLFMWAVAASRLTQVRL